MAYVILILLTFITGMTLGCAKVGPDFVRPEVQLSTGWIESGDTRVTTGDQGFLMWWRGFNDPVLERLIEAAYRQNPSLAIAGVRVLEARARLGIAVGGLYPQSQTISGYVQHNRVSENSIAGGIVNTLRYDQAESTLAVSWELDFWGRLRRYIESADAAWIATVADYDNALVSLTADVANSYILIRTLEKRILIARQNVEAQAEILKIAEARFRLGTASARDVEQARAFLTDTKATVPPLESLLRQTKNGLSVLLGIPPNPLREMLSGESGIPAPPARVAVGIPADLLRRRPDIRSAEFQARSQSALIGAAKGDLYPSFSLTGFFGFLSTDVGDSQLRNIFRLGSREYTAGPAFSWNVLNYGRISNQVRVQDARLQQLLISYQAAVLKAQQEVEDGLAVFLRSQDRAVLLSESVQAGKRSFQLAKAQYVAGTVDFTVVLVAEQNLLTEQDNLAVTVGNIATGLVSVYRALGGGWEIREERDLVPDEIKRAMAQRTNWGNLLDPPAHIPGTGEEKRRLIRAPDW
ncbi:MAG TPA: efflux transporter outer membrane subunit [Syntrophorhabdaceae bacterium]